MADTKVETISRLAQWKIENFGPCSYKKSDPFKVGIWNWYLSVEKNRYLYVRLFPESSKLSKEQPPLARFILRVSISGTSRKFYISPPPAIEAMTSSLQKPPVDDSVLIRVTHSNLKSFSADVRFSLQMSVESVKEKLWKKCGTSVESMRLELYDESGSRVSDLSDSSRPFGFYSPLDGYRLHIIDLDPSSVTSGGWLEDTSLVEKYKISDEAYDKLDGTFRKFKEKMVAQNPSAFESKIKDDYMEDLCANIKVGDRCEVEPGAKRGVVKFVGRAESIAAGFWVGVQYDEPLGKHDGMVKGVRYFVCPQLHGAMVRPDKVKVGDYPERDIFEEDEI